MVDIVTCFSMTFMYFFVLNWLIVLLDQTVLYKIWNTKVNLIGFKLYYYRIGVFTEKQLRRI